MSAKLIDGDTLVGVATALGNGAEHGDLVNVTSPVERVGQLARKRHPMHGRAGGAGRRKPNHNPVNRRTSDGQDAALGGGDVADAVALPTDLGKSPCVLLLLARVHNRTLPTRVVYVVDRRALVDQSADAVRRRIAAAVAAFAGRFSPTYALARYHVPTAKSGTNTVLRAATPVASGAPPPRHD